MITLRRAEERYHDRRRQQEVFRTFFRDHNSHAFADGFGALGVLNEDFLAPSARIARHGNRGAEIITYVCEGGLAYEDSMGRSGVILAGEFQRMTDGRGNRYGETNASRTDSAHVFQLSLRACEAGLEPSYEQKRFTVAERRNELRVVTSPDGQRGSLRIHQDALIYSSILDPGMHIVHELKPGRSVWLHVVKGEATFEDFVLTAGDGAGITEERVVSLTARNETEILLVDLGEKVQMA